METTEHTEDTDVCFAFPCLRCLPWWAVAGRPLHRAPPLSLFAVSSRQASTELSRGRGLSRSLTHATDADGK